jgi:hypothetical protein
MKKLRSRKRKEGPAPPSVRLPLPRKIEKRHGEAKKYDRQRERARIKKLLIED